MLGAWDFGDKKAFTSRSILMIAKALKDGLNNKDRSDSALGSSRRRWSCIYVSFLIEGNSSLTITEVMGETNISYKIV